MKKLAYAVALALVAPVIALTPTSVAHAAPAQGRGYHSPNTPFTTTSTWAPYQASSEVAPGLKCQNGWGFTQTDLDNVWGNGTPKDLQTACVDAMVAGEALWKMLADWGGRNGYDGNGRAAPVRVGAGSGYTNWQGSYAVVGMDSTSSVHATSIDLVSQQLAHMVVNTLGTGTPAADTKAFSINEAAVDIIATATEWHANNPGDTPDYTIGEKVNLLGQGPIRNLANPLQTRQNNCVSSSPFDWDQSGPVDHWFYLLAEGSNPTNGQPSSPICAGGPSSVTGIGLKPAFQIFMKALESRTATWTVADLRKATLLAAKNSTPGQCSAYLATQAAWAAVSQYQVEGEVGCGQTVPMDFSISADRTQASTYADEWVRVKLTSARLSGDPADVQLRVDGLPSGVDATFENGQLTMGVSGGTGTVGLTLKSSNRTTAEAYSFTIVATSPTQTKTIPFTWTVTQRPAPVEPGVSFSVNANRAISWLYTTETALNVPYSATASQVKLTLLGVRHSCIENLRIRLIAPDGSEYAIQDGGPPLWLCGSYQDQDFVRDKERLSAESTQGTWRLRVSSTSWRTGSWAGWKITFP